ncbi:ketopantoate reductase family protein [Pseudoclavibacter chungangensis]|uniref:2-dehydropantoate 2-reductase n=1 Tax=Pseudoclavibacter chungangensis TaxID=587635 RepID=A0A7J5BSL2_9MICO|nr:2-dehydropantoate 2-reductase [Pseudoclavibacter chungangensis]KAB1657297.1 ketopantoate reductase family protein [Pseudoclavibacter chungangensis]NYJ66255.1 2-dehydropantoate 2-reductase [Pseudoclavibacter chungangensis]
MRIGVIGAGAVGTTVAALLAAAGHEVHVAARRATAETIAADGLHLDGAFGRHAVAVAADERLPPGLDLALCATQAHDAAAALAANADALVATSVVALQNGLGGVDTAARVLGGRRDVHGALVLFAATGTAAGRAVATARGPVFVGAGSGWASPASRRVATILASALPARAVDRFTGAQWAKLLVNHVNALPAITGSSVQAVSRDPGLVRVLARSLREAVLVAERQRVRITGLGPLRQVDVHALGHRPFDDAVDVARRLGHAFGPVPNPASTLQAIRRGRRTEIDELNGRVATLAAHHGIDAPVERTLTRLVHEVERSGRFLAPGAVVAAVSA